MYKAKISTQRDDVLQINYINFEFNNRKLQLIANCKPSRCFITDFNFKHHIQHSQILTNVKSRLFDDKRLREIYNDLNVELTQYNACIDIDTEQWIDFIKNSLF